MKTWIVVVAEDLLQGRRQNELGRVVARALASLGLDARRLIVIGPSPSEAASLLREAVTRADALISVGGIGSTPADRVILDALEILGNSHPSETLIDPTGIADGRATRLDELRVWSLPDHPAAMEALLEQEVLPALAKSVTPESASESSARHVLRVSGVNRPDLARRLVGLEDLERGSLSIRPDDGEHELVLLAKAESQELARLRVQRWGALICKRLGHDVHGPFGEDLTTATAEALRARGWSLALLDIGLGGEVAWRLSREAVGRAVLSFGVTFPEGHSAARWLGLESKKVGDFAVPNERILGLLASNLRERTKTDVAVAL